MGYYRTGDFYRGARGDFYRGARGDPGLFGDILSGFGGVVGKILPLAAPIIGGAIGGPVGAAIGGVAGGFLGNVMGATAPGSTSLPIVSSPALLQRPPMRSLTPAVAGGIGGTLVTPALGTAERYVSGKVKRGYHALMHGGRRHRRMNPLNPRALRRALRRAKGFEHFARGVLRITRPGPHKVHFKMPRKRRRSA